MTAAISQPEVNKPLVVSHPGEGADVLLERFREWGYLFLKGGLTSELCSKLLDQLMHELDPDIAYGSSQRPTLQGTPVTECDPLWDRVYPKIQSLEAFHSFFHEPEVLRLMQLVCGPEVFVYPMKMARIATPLRIGFETPPHQDAHSHNAPKNMAGIWVALHDVSDGMGRLKVLPRSHRHGVRTVFEAQGVGGVQCEIFADETTWHVSDVQCGDVILFDGCTVHKAEANTSAEDVRISVDTRFCVHGTPVFSTNLHPHHGWRIDQLSWDYIYRDWESKDYQYYWEDYPELF